MRDSTLAAMARISARSRRLALDPAASLSLLPNASPLRAQASGYLVEIDVGVLARRARRAGVRARIGRAVGDYVDGGEIVGWARSDPGTPVPAAVARRLASTLEQDRPRADRHARSDWGLSPSEP